MNGPIDAVEDSQYWSQFGGNANPLVGASHDDQDGQTKRTKQSVLDSVIHTLKQNEELLASCLLPRPMGAGFRNTIIRRTRRGRIRKDVLDLYLQEAFPCGVVDCRMCCEDDGRFQQLDVQPSNCLSDGMRIIIADVPVALEADFLWDDACINNVVILQSVLEDVQQRNKRSYRRLLRLCGFQQPPAARQEPPPGRHFYLYPNSAVASAYVDRQEGESDAAYRVRQIQRAAAWYARHRAADYSSPPPGHSRPVSPTRECILLIDDDDQQTSTFQSCSSANNNRKGTFSSVYSSMSSDQAKQARRGSFQKPLETASWTDSRKDTSHSVVILTDSADSKAQLTKGLPLELQGTTTAVAVYDIHDWVSRARADGRYPSAGEKLACHEPTSSSPSDTAAAAALTQTPLRPSPETIKTRLRDLGLDLCINKASVVLKAQVRKQQPVYPPHLPSKLLLARIRSGKVFCGKIRMYTTSCWKATVIVNRDGQDEPLELKIAGSTNINRAVDGDIVAVQLLDESDVQGRTLAIAQQNTLDGVDDEDAPTITPLPDEITLTGTNNLAKVVGILKRNWKTYCGSLQRRDPAYPTSDDRKFIPASAKIPSIIIKTRQSNELEGCRLVACIDSWDCYSLHPKGHWIENLGPAGTDETEAKVILREHDVIVREFSPAVLKCLPPDDYTIPAKTISERLDLRLKFCFCDLCRWKRNKEPIPGEDSPKLKELLGTPCFHYMAPNLQADPLKNWDTDMSPPYRSIIKKRKLDPYLEEYDLDPSLLNSTICCSIDPPTCVDIDDALSVKFLKNGNYEIGVHIADVTHYVKPDTAIDREAADRCTTVYLVNQRTDMLPKLLSADICSLRAGVDRLSFSCIWEMTPNAEIKHTRFYKTVMHSVAAFEYQQAQNVIDDAGDKSPIAVRLRILNELAKKLRERRCRQGAVELASNEVKFKFDENGNPEEVIPYPELEANHLVEEFMLLANISAAERISAAFPDCAVLRRHPPPKSEGLEALAKILASKGFKFNFGTSKELADSLNRIKRSDDPQFNKQLRVITVQCMNQAVYYCAGDIKDEARRRHYALATPLYTHFTSPIRRYADVLVHRLLAASLNLSTLPCSMSQTSGVVELCDKMTERHRNAQSCGRNSAIFYAYKLFSRKGNLQVKAIVTQVRRNGCLIQVPEWGVDGQARIHPNKYTFNPQTQTLTDHQGQTISMLDNVLVKVEASDEDYRFRVSYSIVEKIEAAATAATRAKKRSRSRGSK